MSAEISATDVVSVAYPEPYIVVVTLNRPEARNAISSKVARRLESIVRETEADTSVRAVILTGSGNIAFCAGADLRAIDRGEADHLSTAEGGFAGFVRCRRTKPWIAAINGAALAGGLEIALSCDIVIGVSHSSYGLPEVKRGLIAAAGGLYRLPRVMPKSLSMQMIATGESITATRAYENGLISSIETPESLMPSALEIARSIAAASPLAVSESLQIARQVLCQNEVALGFETTEARRRVMASGDFQEGVRAFVEKRSAVWSSLKATKTFAFLMR